MPYELTLFVYFAYLLSISIIYLLLLRCRNSDSSDIGIKEIPSGEKIQDNTQKLN